MQLHDIRSRTAFLSDLLSRAHLLSFRYQQAIIVTISTEINVIVLYYKQFTKTHDTGACIDHFARGNRDNIITTPSGDINSLVHTR